MIILGFIAISGLIGTPIDTSILSGFAKRSYDSLFQSEISYSKNKLSPDQVRALVAEVSREHNISPELLMAVITVESNFDAKAVSHAGAMGLMQLMPATIEEMKVENPFDPKENIRGGAKYLKQLLERYNGNKTLALAAYNAGPDNVRRYRGVPPFKETKHYVRKVLGVLKSSGSFSV